jgi:acetyl-CoA carboxylase carboxyltransferase component
MGAEAAVNAVYYNRIQQIEDAAEREAYVARLRAEYEADVDIVHLASELVVDAIVEPEELRGELIARFAAYRTKHREFSRRRHGVTPV